MYSNGYFAVVEKEKFESNEEKIWPKFCGSNLKIFNSILTDTLEINEEFESTSEEGNKELSDWKVTFFKDNIFAQTLKLKVVHKGFFDSKPDVVKISKTDRDSIAAKVALMTNTNEKNNEYNCKNASWFVCGNQAIKHNHLNVLPREWRHIDGNGLIILDKFGNLDYPKKHILMLMLAIAYTQAFEEISEKLAAALKPIKSEVETIEFDKQAMERVEYIEKLYAQAAEFNARYYFLNPVRINNYPTFQCWQDIREAYQLQTQYHELNEQIDQVYSILSHLQKQRNYIANERWYKKITVVGLFLSAVGLITVFDTLIQRFGKVVGVIVGVLLLLLLFVIYKKLMLREFSIK